MSRTEKIVAFLLSLLVFAGLFYFIFTSLRAPVNAPALAEPDYYGDEEDLFEFDEEQTAAPVPAAPTPENKPTSAPKAESKK